MDIELEIAALRRTITEAETLVHTNMIDFDKRNRMILRQRKLYDAAVAGSIYSLNKLIQEDRLILHRPSVDDSDETPLHIAAMLGHVSFATALLALRCDLLTERDGQGRLPLHLASTNGHLDMVRVLVSLNPGTCLYADEDGRTSLHLAMMKGRMDVLKKLYHVKAEAAKLPENNGDYILHLGVKHNHLEAIKLMVEMTKDQGLLNAKNGEGNTILHLAAAYKQIETVKFLLETTGIEVNSINKGNLTALDIMDYAPRDFKAIELKELLINAGARKAQQIPSSTELNYGILQNQRQKHDSLEKWLEQQHTSLGIAATVIAAMAYQAGLSPPGGIWDNNVTLNETIIVYHAGTSIMAANYPDGYAEFWKFNTVSLIASLSIIFFLISGLPITKKIYVWVLMAAMWVAISFMALTYLESMKAILYIQLEGSDYMRPITKMVRNTLFVWLGVVGFAFLVHTVRLLMMVSRIVKNLKRLKAKALRKRRLGEFFQLKCGCLYA